MDATGRDGGRKPWSYLGQTGYSRYSISSASSGTVSTGYTSSGSRMSSISSDAAMHFDLELEEDMSWIETGKKDTAVVRPIKKPRKETEKKHTEFARVLEKEMEAEKLKQIIRMTQEFFDALSTNCRIKGGDMGVLKRWFRDLDVEWVLDDSDGASANGARTWIRAFTEITKTIRLVASLNPDRGSRGLPSICEGEPEPESRNRPNILDQFQFAQFIQITMSKMLAFVDLIVAPNTKTTIDGVSLPFGKLRALLGVHGALSSALPWIRLPFLPQPSAATERIQNEIVSLLSAKEQKMCDAIWSIMEQNRTNVLELIEDGSSSSLTPQGSSRIHEVTRSIVSNIGFLLSGYSSVAAIVSQASRLGKYVPQIGNEQPLDSMIIEMASCLQKNLAIVSESFSDQSLSFLFLLHNSYFIRQQLQHIARSSLQIHLAALFGKVESYMESYLQVSWTPMLSYFLNPTPLCFGKNYSPLAKFESAFLEVYTTQKQWKVPDPELRKTLRRATTEKIIPSYKSFIEDNKITTPKFSPQELIEMLQELFEG